MLILFESFLDRTNGDYTAIEQLEELMNLRAEIAFIHACDGFSMSYEDAIELIRNYDGELTEEQKNRRDILLAALDNIVDFAVAEEYQMLLEINELDSEDFESDEDFEDMVVSIFTKYNQRFANVENMDIEYAMIVAASIMMVKPTTYLTYMTQGDERVRPWHMQYEGFTAPKQSFPAWLIPPIEHMCRCFLVEDTNAQIDIEQVLAKKVPEMPDWFNPTFKESVALGGRIFSDEHPYFQVKPEDLKVLGFISDKIKKRFKDNEK